MMRLKQLAFDFTNKTVVVTGAAGILGREFARAFAASGGTVVQIDVKKTDPDTGPTIRCDVSDRISVNRVASYINRHYGTPDVLVNCAAIDVTPSRTSRPSGLPNTDTNDRNMRRLMDVNVYGTIYCCQEFGAMMEAAGRGSMINISSIYGHVSPDQSIYLKNGKRSFFKPLSYCLSKAGIPIVTRYFASYFPHVRTNTLTFGGVYNQQDSAFVRKYSAKTLIGRMADRSEYIAAVLTLASDDMSYATGGDWHIEGGYLSL